MGNRYAVINRFQLDLLNRNTAHLHEYIEVSESLAELMLWGMERLPAHAVGNEEADPISSRMTILVRLFNDFEAAKLCTLRGLPDQAIGSLRDTIECTMLVRLFQAEPKVATRWLTHANEYTPGTVYAELEKQGIIAFEYGMYGFLSDRTHPNLMGSLGTLKETDHGGGNITVEWGVGGYESPVFIRLSLLFVCILQVFALVGPLADLFRLHFSDDDWKVWRYAVEGCRATLSALVDGQKVDREPIDVGGAALAIAKFEKKQDKWNQKILAEMRKLFGPEFSFDD